MRKRSYLLRACVTAAIFILSLNSARSQGKQPKPSSTTTTKDSTGKSPLLTVLRDLNRRKGVFFLYAEDNMSRRLVNPVRDHRLPVEKILEDVLRNTGLRFKKVSENTFVILGIETSTGEGEYDIGGSLSNPLPPEITWAGKVMDTEGNLLSGVSIVVKGTERGTITDHRGQFSLEAARGETLTISSVGFQSREITMTDDPSSIIVLNRAEREMSEVVVTALGIRKTSNSLGFSFTKLEGDEFTKAREINLGNALVGKVAGVNSSAPLTGPGGSSRVTIRGNSSLSFDNQPLYVVNGIPINNDNLGSAGKFGGADFGDGINSINPDDVGDITVLKGGSAAALYGQRGRNGVILINTKTGKGKRALGIEVNSNFMFDRINDFTDFQQEYGQGFQGSKPVDQPSALLSGLYSWGAPLDGSPVTLFDGRQHPYAPVSKNNLDRFYRTGSTFTNTVAIFGGSDAGYYRVSLGDLRNSAVYPNAKYIRDNINVDLNYRLSEKWSGQTNISYIKEIGRNRSNISDAPGNGNFAILFLPPNVRADYLAPGYNASGQETEFNDNAFNTNPYFAAARFKNDTDRDRVLGVGSIRYQPWTGVYVQARIANDFFSFNASSITPTGTAYKPSGTINLERSYDYNEMNADILVGWAGKINKDLGFSLTAGGNLLKMRSRVLDVSADGLSFPFLYNPANASSSLTNLTTPKKEVQSVYGSAELSFKNSLFLTITDRNDWSSTLPKGKNSYNYPSVSASYVFAKPSTASWLSLGKLRAGYAMVGGDAPVFATLLYYNLMGSINGNPIGNLNNEIPNFGLEPLKVTELEIGAELKFLDNRLFADIAWYDKRTLNDIVAATVSITSGFYSALVNVGKIRNTGIEILIGGTPVQTKHFGWKSSFNIADNRNKVIRLSNGQQSMQVPNGDSRTERGFVQHIVGMPFSQVMVYDVRRDSKGLPILGPNGLQAADVLIAKGTGVHPVTGGWTNEFRYRQFGLSFLVDFKYGAVLYSGTNATAIQRGLHKETLEGRESGVTVTGVDGQGNLLQQTYTAQNYYNELYRISALQVYNADFVKFRSLALTWSVPVKFLGKKIESLNLSVVGRNLFYINKQTSNIDPEANYTNGNAQGLEYAALPSVRSYGCNINVRF